MKFWNTWSEFIKLKACPTKRAENFVRDKMINAHGVRDKMIKC